MIFLILNFFFLFTIHWFLAFFFILFLVFVKTLDQRRCIYSFLKSWYYQWYNYYNYSHETSSCLQGINVCHNFSSHCFICVIHLYVNCYESIWSEWICGYLLNYWIINSCLYKIFCSWTSKESIVIVLSIIDT